MENNNTEKELEKKNLIEEAQSFKNSPWVFFVKRSKLTYLIIAFILIFGITTIRNLPKELNPEVEIPVALIVTIYPGASPIDIEEQITKKVENQIGDLEGIKRISSTSSLGVSTVVAEFGAGEKLEDSIRKLKDKVGDINNLPENAISPKVTEISLSDQPIIIATITGENYDINEIKKFAENLKNRLKGVPFVSDVQVIGGKEKLISIDIDSSKIEKYGLSLSQVVSSISANNLDFPIGSINLENSNYSIRLEGQFKNYQEIGLLQITSKDGKPVYLEDIAQIKESFGKDQSKSRISVFGQEPSEAVSIQVYKRTGGDITKVSEDVRSKIESARGIDYPNDTNVVITLDLSEIIRESINTLSSSGIQTVILIMILLFFFLGLKEALIAGLAIPFSFFIAFISMSFFEQSLNFLSLFSLVLALGLLVDSAVVIVEGMYQKVSRFQISGNQSAILTIKEYAAPLLSGMLTTVAAFVPLLFVIGIFGEFIKTIPVVVVSTLVAALFVSLTIIPAVGGAFMNPIKNSNEDKNNFWSKINGGIFGKICLKIKFLCKSKPRSKRIATKIFDKISEKYCEFLPKIISTKKQRKKLILGVWVLLIFSFLFPFLGILKIQSFVPYDSDFFFVSLEMPNGTAIEKTDKTVRKIEDVLRNESRVVNFVTNVGSKMGFSAGASNDAGSLSSNMAFIQANLSKKEERKEKSFEIIEEIRKKLEVDVTEGKIEIQEQESGPPTGSPIELRVKGDDLAILDEIAENIKNELAQIPTVIDVKTSIKQNSGEFVFVPNKEILAKNGLNVFQLGLELRNSISRNTDDNIKKQGDEIIISVGIDEDRLDSIEGIKDISIISPLGKKIFVSELGEIEFRPSPASIERFEKERIVSVTAGTNKGNPTEITNILKNKIDNMDIPSGYKIEFGGESEELQEVFMDMFMKMIIGIILILFILIIQFNSYRQVLIILFTIPLAMIGVIWGMTLARLVIDIPSFIGIVSLAGIVVNNAIILIDEINRQLSKGEYVIEGVKKASRNRLRPVFLTTITTVFGLLPLSITQPDWRNMGFTIIFGLLFSMFLTLVVVPTLYISFYKGKLNKENL